MKDWLFYRGSFQTRGQKFWEWPLEAELTVIGFVALGLILLGYLMMLLIFPNQLGEVTCTLRILTGLYCPVCGGSRAALYLLTGHFLKSLWMNPMVLVGAVICGPFLGLNTACWCSKGRVWGMRYHNIYLFIIVAVCVLNCIYKNWILITKGIALIP